MFILGLWRRHTRWYDIRAVPSVQFSPRIICMEVQEQGARHGQDPLRERGRRPCDEGWSSGPSGVGVRTMPQPLLEGRLLIVNRISLINEAYSFDNFSFSMVNLCIMNKTPSWITKSSLFITHFVFKYWFLNLIGISSQWEMDLSISYAVTSGEVLHDLNKPTLIMELVISNKLE